MDSQVLLALALSFVGGLSTSIVFWRCFVFFALVARFIPEPTLAPSSDLNNKKKNGDEGGNDMMKKYRCQVLFSGIIAAIGISLHNFPEGMAVFLGSIKGLGVGINLALAIALHNIPEGVAACISCLFCNTEIIDWLVSLQISLSKWHAFKLATLVAYLFPSSLGPEILEGLLVSVGGVMAFLTLHELLPLAFDYTGQKQAVKAVFFGMAFMSAR